MVICYIVVDCIFFFFSTIAPQGLQGIVLGNAGAHRQRVDRTASAPAILTKIVLMSEARSQWSVSKVSMPDPLREEERSSLRSFEG